MGAETEVGTAPQVRVPSDGMPAAEPAEPELVDAGTLGWHELRKYAKSIGVPLVGEDRKIRSKAKLTEAVQARQAERWPGQVPQMEPYLAPAVGAEQVTFESGSSRAGKPFPEAPPSEGDGAPALSTPASGKEYDLLAQPGERIIEGGAGDVGAEGVRAPAAGPTGEMNTPGPAGVAGESLPEQPTMAAMVEPPPEPEPPKPTIRCIGCGKPVEGLPADFDPTAEVLCLACDAARAAVVTAAAQDHVDEKTEEPAISDEELDNLVLDEPSLVADAPSAKQTATVKEPPGDGPWQLWSPFGSFNPIVRQARSAVPLPHGGETPRVSGLSVQFVEHEATVKDKALMRFLMQMAAWDRGEMRFKGDILREGLVAREADLIIDKARAGGLAIPDRDSLIANLTAETSGSAPLPDRTSRGVTPGKGSNTPALNFGPVSTRPTAPVGAEAFTRGPLGSGADIETLPDR